MKEFNMRKFLFISAMALGIGTMTVAYQNFTSSSSLSETTKQESSMYDTLQSAMRVAEKEHLQKQIALNVEPSQVENTLKKQRKISTVEVQADTATDDKESAREAQPLSDD